MTQKGRPKKAKALPMSKTEATEAVTEAVKKLTDGRLIHKTRGWIGADPVPVCGSKPVTPEMFLNGETSSSFWTFVNCEACNQKRVDDAHKIMGHL